MLLAEHRILIEPTFAYEEIQNTHWNQVLPMRKFRILIETSFCLWGNSMPC